MPSTQQGPTIIEDIGALADLYVGVFKMMGRRLNPRAPKQKLPMLPDEMLPPPLPDRQELARQREFAARHN